MIKRMLAVALIAVVLLTGLGLPAVAQSPTEVIELRTENSKTYDLGNGRRVLEVSMGAVHYKDNYNNPTEKWKDIDLTLVNNGITKAPYTFTIDQKSHTAIFTDKKTGDVVVLMLFGIPAGKLADYIMPFEAESSGIRFILPHNANISIGKSKPVTSISISERVDGSLTMVDIDDKTASGFSRRVNSIINLQVGASTDDCDKRWSLATSTWTFSLTEGGFLAGYENENVQKVGAGMRLLNVTIPPGSTIDTAYLTITCIVGRSGVVVRSIVRGEAADNAATFSTVANYDARTRTTALVYWDAIPAWTLDAAYNSPEIKTVVQEIVNRGGWLSGNAMVFFWDDHDGRSTAGNGTDRIGYAYDASTSKAPKLHIEYTPPSGPTVTSSAATDVSYTTATLHGEITAAGGPNATIRGFEWDTDTGAPYANDWHEHGDYGLGTFSHIATGLPVNTTIYWRAYATNSAGTGYSAPELSFTTLLPLPLAPTDFTITKTGVDEVTLTWTTGTYAATTRIMVKEDNYPVDTADGYVVYDGALETATLDGLDLTYNTYYFRAWSHNDTGYSTDAAEGQTGGSMLLIGIIAFMSMGFMVSTFIFRLKVLAFMAAAFWLVLGVFFLNLSTVMWDTYYYLFFVCGVGMTLLCAFLPFMLRERKDIVEDDGLDDEDRAFKEETETMQKERDNFRRLYHRRR